MQHRETDRDGFVEAVRKREREDTLGEQLSWEREKEPLRGVRNRERGREWVGCFFPHAVVAWGALHLKERPLGFEHLQTSVSSLCDAAAALFNVVDRGVVVVVVVVVVRRGGARFNGKRRHKTTTRWTNSTFVYKPILTQFIFIKVNKRTRFSVGCWYWSIWE